MERTPPRSEDRVVFDAVLTPNRSLSPRGFVVLMCGICAISFTAGLFFFLVGAWPVVGFMGLDVLLIYLAFRINYRRGRMYETLRLTPRRLAVRRVDSWGEARQWSFQPAWLQVLMDEPPGDDSRLILRSHGRSLAIGGFLTLEERVDLARTLRAAIAEALAVPRPG